MSWVKKAIPDWVEAWWHEYRAALKGVEKEQLGTDVVSESVEMAGWGVAEAEEHNRAEASKFCPFRALVLFRGDNSPTLTS